MVNKISLLTLLLQHGKTRGEVKEAANGSSAFLITCLHLFACYVQVKA
jgi:hypothetical protein